MDHSKFNPDRFTRQSLRLDSRDYSEASAYFVTIRANRPEPIFDEPVLRCILLGTWEGLPDRFPGVVLDEFVIMPDPVHFIIWLQNGEKGENGQKDEKSEKGEKDVKNKQTDAPALGSIVGTFKSKTTHDWIQHIKAAQLNCPGLIWQRNYYERVVRVSELQATRQYICDNPTKQEMEHR